MIAFGLFGKPANACMRDFDPNADIQQIKCEKGILQGPVVAGLLGRFVGSRRIAVIAAVSEYRNETLAASAEDASNLVAIFRDVLEYEEIYLVRNKQFKSDTLRAMFSRYIPEVARTNKVIAVVFAFSGHGVQFEDDGYILKSDAPAIRLNSNAEKQYAISFKELREILSDTVRKSQYFLALINSCHSGRFFAAAPPRELGIGQRAAVAITAGPEGSLVYGYPKIFGEKSGSAFFALFASAIRQSQVAVLDQKINTRALDNGIANFSEVYNTILRGYEVVERQRPLRPLQGSLIDPPGDGAFSFVLDRKKATEFYGKVVDRGSIVTGYGQDENSKSPIVRSGLIDPVVRTRYGDWIVLEAGRPKDRYCVAQSEGIHAYNAYVERSLSLRAIEPFANGQATTLRLSRKRNMPTIFQYVSAYDLSRQLPDVQTFHISVQNSMGNEEAQQPLIKGGIFEISSEIDFERVRQSDSMSITAEQKIEIAADSKSFLNLSEAGKARVESILAADMFMSQILLGLGASPKLKWWAVDWASAQSNALSRVLSYLSKSPDKVGESDLSMIQSFTVEDIAAPLSRALKGRFVRYEDELSLIGIKKAEHDLYSCSQDIESRADQKPPSRKR